MAPGRKKWFISYDYGARELGEVRELTVSLPVSFADKSEGAARHTTANWRALFSYKCGCLFWGSDEGTLAVVLTEFLRKTRSAVSRSASCRSAMKRKMMNRDVSRNCVGETSHRSDEVVGNDPILEPKHKIFLSHSGAQKEMVDHLCKALEDRFHYPFFDRRHESLPKGEKFPELIVQAAKQCEMLIVVVSNEYFMSKWPMIELSAFVQAHKLHHESKNSTHGPKIFPLFYGLSVGDLEDTTMQKKWFQEWETLAKADQRNRIIVSDWKYALNVLRSFNGLSYNTNLKEIVAYEEEIVSYVCKSISPDIKWDDSHVQGKSNILKVIGEKIEGVGVLKKYKVKVVGVYGVGGIGKTTTCKTLCNELLNKYEGRVCHVEFPIVPWSDSKEFFQKVLRDLTRKSMDVIQHLNEGECKDIFCKTLFQQRSFLAIDNISDSHQSIQLAKTFLELPYHIDSLVVVTARSQSVLEFLGINGHRCLEMPDLGEIDAMRLFLQNATSGQQGFEDEEKHDIMTCVRRCYFSKGDGQGHHYHPLALQALGLQLGCYRENPSLWVKHLPRVRTFNYLSGGNPVFDILRSGFDLLPPRDQTLFMDLQCFLHELKCDIFLSLLCTIHKQDEEEITYRLEHLKQKGLLQHVDLKSGTIIMHDLYLEFTKLEVIGSFNQSTNLKKRMWVYIENGDLTELKYKPKGGCWHKLTRLTIKHLWLDPNEHEGVGQFGNLEGIKWDYFSNVEVLHLHRVHLEQGVLNLEGLVSLRILELAAVKYIDGIEGLGELKNLTHFRWFLRDSSNGVPVRIVGQLPSSLKLLEITGLVVLALDALAQCRCLVKLSLRWVEALSLDLSNCWSLESIYLWGIQKLQALLGLTTQRSSNLQSLTVWQCMDLLEILGTDHLIGLKKLHTDINLKCEVPNLLALTQLQFLKLYGLEKFVVHSKDFFPRQLRQLQWCLSQSSEGLNLNGCNLLEVLDLRDSDGLTSLAELGCLPALRRLDLRYCEHLLHLPNLSKSRNLEEVYLAGCLVLELHESDIQMLSELPLLQPLPFENELVGKGQSFRVDVCRGKVLVHQSLKAWACNSWELWKAGEWEERDLDSPPILIGKLGPFQTGKEDGMDSDSADSDWFQIGKDDGMDLDSTDSD